MTLVDVLQVDKVTGRFNGQFKTYAICGAIRRMVSALAWLPASAVDLGREMSWQNQCAGCPPFAGAAVGGLGAGKGPP